MSKMVIVAGGYRSEPSEDLVSEYGYSMPGDVAAFGDAMMLALEERDFTIEVASLFVHRLAPYVLLGLSMSYEVEIVLRSKNFREESQINYLSNNWPSHWPQFFVEEK